MLTGLLLKYNISTVKQRRIFIERITTERSTGSHLKDQGAVSVLSAHHTGIRGCFYAQNNT